MKHPVQSANTAMDSVDEPQSVDSTEQAQEATFFRRLRAELLPGDAFGLLLVPSTSQ